MTYYGISDPDALSDATRIARRAGMGFVMAAVACNLARAAGYDMAAPRAFSLVFGYLFFGAALATAARRRMLLASPRTGTTSRLVTIAMMGGGFLLLVGSASTLATLVGITLSAPAG
jgi:hypothetical protein